MTRLRMAVIGKRARPAAPGDGLGLGGVGVRDADEFHAGQFGQDAGVFLPQMPDADHPHAQAIHIASFPQAATRHGSRNDAAI